MTDCTFRFYDGLCDFLSAEKKQREFFFPFAGTPSVKDTIEAAGVPHVEVDLILIDGRPADFAALLKGGERIAVYPLFKNLDADPRHRLLPDPPDVHRFVLDVHLGRLARYLRLAGFDTLYDNSYRDAEIVDIARRDDRIVLTCDVGLLKHRAVIRGYWLRSTSPRRQLTEVVDRFELRPRFTPFSRCLMCNGLVRAADPGEVRNRVVPRILRAFDRFSVCDGCGRVYWRGSHYDRLAAVLRGYVERSAPARFALGPGRARCRAGA